MKWHFAVLLFVGLAASFAFAWDKYDHEIFDLVSELEADGQSSFYGWLDVSPTATTSEIARAYRKLSMQLHPDKNPNVKGAHERFARLSKVSSILRDGESRTYDFFYKNGVPKWRGTGYYYSRFRPGLGSVFAFLILVTSGVHYIIQTINYKRDIERIDRFVAEARLAAWGPKMIPVDGARKVKVGLGGPYGDSRSVEMLVSQETVYILDPSGARHLLDRSAATIPSFANTWFLSLVKSLFSKFSGRTSEEEAPADSSDDTDSQSEDTSDSLQKSRSTTPIPSRGSKKRKGRKQ